MIKYIKKKVGTLSKTGTAIATELGDGCSSQGSQLWREPPVFLPAQLLWGESEQSLPVAACQCAVQGLGVTDPKHAVAQLGSFPWVKLVIYFWAAAVQYEGELTNLWLLYTLLWMWKMKMAALMRYAANLAPAALLLSRNSWGWAKLAGLDAGLPYCVVYCDPCV